MFQMDGKIEKINEIIESHQLWMRNFVYVISLAENK